MSCAIPCDLDSQWFLSDVVLLAENAEGRELHVSRALLSSASPVFQAMFSSSFQEGTKGRIDISSDYNPLKEVLRFVHHLGCHCCPTTITDEELLFSMYTAADMWDLSIVRRKVLEMAKEIDTGLVEEILGTFGAVEGKVPCAIPQNFDASWFLSDAEVVSREGERFHVSKVMLSLGSLFFRDQFLDQKNSSVELPISSDILKEILHQMHHIHCDCSHGVTDSDTLLQVHLAANWLNIPKIKEASLPQLGELPQFLKEETKMFIQGERNSLISLCQKLSSDELKTFLSNDDPRPLFSKRDVATLCKISPNEKTSKRSKVANFHFENEIYGMTPLTWPCNLYDVKIIPKNSDGKFLFAKKALLAKHSNFFAKKFLENDWSEGKSSEGYDVIRMDEEYPTACRIVSFVMGCEKAFIGLSPPFIYEIYQAASEARLDMPRARELCREFVGERWEVSYLELAIRLKLDKEKIVLLERMTEKGDDLKDWIEGSCPSHSYVKDGEEIVIETKNDEHILTSKNALKIYDRLKVIKSTRRVRFSYVACLPRPVPYFLARNRRQLVKAPQLDYL